MPDLTTIRNACVTLFLISSFCISTNSNAQKKKGFLNSLSQTMKDVKEAATGTKKAVKEVSATSKEVNNSVKNFKKTWVKDTSSNIRYVQVPDYRSREEVEIKKTQKLSVENGEFLNLSWQPIAKFDQQLFPSFIIGWATYNGIKTEDMGSSLGFNIRTSLPGVVLKWEIESVDKSFFSLDSGYINCDELKYTGTFMPRIAWNIRTLVKHETSSPLGVYFRLTDPNTGAKVERLVNLNLRSINDCMTYYAGTSYSNMFVAFANEDHPEIDKILKEALDTKMISSISGYQPYGSKKQLTKEEYEEAKKNVDLQVAAIWRVLHNRGFQYSSITDNSGDNSAKVFSQTVRTFDNSMKTQQANCVDGTVVMASILKRIGLRPKLILVPGHCFLAYNNDRGITNDLTFVETTMMSSKTYMTKDSVAKYYSNIIVPNYPKERLKTATEKDKAYYLQFYVAQFSATNSFYNKKNEGKTVIIDLEDERKKISPIPLLE